MMEETMLETYTIKACDGGQPGKPYTSTNKLNVALANATIDSIGRSQREQDRVVTSIVVSEGKMVAHCYDENDEHVCDLSWRPTREGWFMSG